MRKEYTDSYYICPSNDYNYYFNKISETKLSRAAVCFTDNIREEQLNKRYKRFAHQPRVRNFNKYFFLSHRGKFVEEHKRIRMGKLNIKKEMQKYTRLRTKLINRGFEVDQVDEFLIKRVNLPLPINKVSRIIGVFKRFKKPGYSKKKINRDVNDYFLYFLRNKFLGFKEFIDSFNMKVYPGDFKYNYNNMIDMCKTRKCEYSVDELIDGYFSRIGIDLVLPEFKDFERRGLLKLDVNYKAKPGILSSQLVGKTRNDTTQFSKPIAYEYLNKIMDKKGKHVLDKSLYDYGGREKRVKSKPSDRNKDIKTRTVFMQEDVPTLIGQSLVKYLMHGLQYLDEGFNYGGRLNGRRNWIKFVNVMKPKSKYDINGNSDFNGHDNKVTETKIVVACAFLRLCFPEGEAMDRLFYYVMSSAVFKRVVLPESNLIYEIVQGLPSGHGLTSILTSLIAYGTFATAINNVANANKVNGVKVGRRRVKERRSIVKRSFIHNAGDDVAYKIDYRYIDEINDEIVNKSGMDIDDLSETCGYFSSSSRHTQTTFLKKKYGFYEFSWNNWELYINLIFPTMKSLSFGNVRNSLLQIVESAPYCIRINNLIKILVIGDMLYKTVGNLDIGYKRSHRVNNRGDPIYIKVDKFTVNECYNFLDFMLAANIDDPLIDKYIMDYDFPIYKARIVDFTEIKYDVDVSLKVRDILKEINNIVSYKSRLLSTSVIFKKHRKVHRLAVFDMAKRMIPACETFQNLIKHF